MQARRAARELALILFSQLNEKFESCNNENFDDLVLKSVRILVNSSNDDLKVALTGLMRIKDSIQSYQAKHETNLNRPIGASDIPVALPMTNEILENIDTVFDVSDKALLALSIAEIATLESNDEVKDYAVKIAQTFKEHKPVIDEQIQKCSTGWDINRMFKMDRDILRIAITELLYIDETPMKVSVDEAVELAKKYSTDESSSFINGILSKVILENGVK
ncbi:transcription antitermination factor NusB [bacterium]|nr:transcription antitermination factor NusB [bacterium]